MAIRKCVPTKERFWSKVWFEPTSGCWLWGGTINQSGYGTFYDNGKVITAHMASLFIHGVEIPEGLVVDHLCSNPTCVNPDHLRVCTQRQNVLRSRSFSAINAKKETCVNGHQFTEANIIRGKNNRRQCRQCNKDIKRERYHSDARYREHKLSVMRAYKKAHSKVEDFND